MACLSFTDLPKDIVDEIISRLHRLDRFLLGITCRDLRGLTDGYRPCEMLCYDAALLAYCDVFKWAMALDLSPDTTLHNRTILDSAAKSGSIQMVELVRGYNHEWTDETLSYAIKSGNIHMCEYVRKSGCPMPPTVYMTAVYTKCMGILRWLAGYIKEQPDDDAATAATIVGRIDILEWLHDNGCQFTQKHIGWATDMKTIRWLRSIGVELSSECMMSAIERDALFLVKWLDRKRCPYNGGSAIDTAAVHGRLDILKWFCLEKKYRPSVFTVGFAARSGNLDMIKWLHARGYVMHMHACITAVRKGHVHVADWAIENGCEWSDSDTYDALDTEKLVVLQWAHSRGFMTGIDMCRHYKDVKIILWALSVGYPANSSLYDRVDLELAKKYHGLGVPLAAHIMTQAAGRGDLQMIEWLESVGCPRTYNVYVAAARAGHLHVIKYAWERGWPYNDAAYHNAPDGIRGWIERNIHPTIG